VLWQVWHPIMAEQKRGRDASAATSAALAASHCYHHFVSSWMRHDKEKHTQTETQRRKTSGAAGGGASARGAAGGASQRSAGGGRGSNAVPTGQGLRTLNPWRSFDVGIEATDGASLSAPPSEGAEAESHVSEEESHVPEAVKQQRRAFVERSAAKRKERRRHAEHRGRGSSRH
jgi:hypothetical protein